MSVADLKKEKLDRLKKTLAECEGFSFRQSLIETFQLESKRTAFASISKETPEPSTSLEPIITTSKTIHPIMSKRHEREGGIPSTKEESQIDVHTPEDSENIALLINSTLSLAQSSSQIKPERKIEILREILNLSAPTFNRIAQSVDFTAWSEDIVLDLCKEIQLMDNISKPVTVLLIEAAIYPKIAELNSTVPRFLMDSILLLAKEQSKLVIDGLVIPLLFQSVTGRPQFDVISKIVTESLKPAHRLLLLQSILSDGEMYYSNKSSENFIRYSLRPWNDGVFQLIGGLLSSQPLFMLTKEALQDIVQTTKVTVDTNPKDKNSMQLLLIVTSKHAKAVAEFEYIEVIENISNTSRMFLKRAVLGQITLIKKSQQSLQESKIV